MTAGPGFQGIGTIVSLRSAFSLGIAFLQCMMCCPQARPGNLSHGRMPWGHDAYITAYSHIRSVCERAMSTEMWDGNSIHLQGLR